MMLTILLKMLNSVLKDLFIFEYKLYTMIYIGRYRLSYKTSLKSFLEFYFELFVKEIELLEIKSVTNYMT